MLIWRVLADELEEPLKPIPVLMPVKARCDKSIIAHACLRVNAF